MLHATDTKHRGVHGLDCLAFAQIHVHTARQAWVEASDRSHDVDSLEIVRAVFLEDRRALYGILIGSRCTVHIARSAVPWRRWIRVIVGDLTATDHHVMRQHTAHRLMKAAANSLFGYLEIGPSPGSTCMQLHECLLHEVHCGSRRVGLEVGACAVAFDRIAPFWDLPLEGYLGLEHGLG